MKTGMGRTERRRLILALLFAAVVVGLQQQALLQTVRGTYHSQVNAALAGFAAELARDLEATDKTSVARRLEALEQTGLFARFAVLNLDKRVQAGFPDEVGHLYKVGPLPVLNSSFRAVGYYSYDRNFSVFYRPFLLYGIGNSILTVVFFVFSVFSCLKVWPSRDEILRR